MVGLTRDQWARLIADCDPPLGLLGAGKGIHSFEAGRLESDGIVFEVALAVADPHVPVVVIGGFGLVRAESRTAGDCRRADRASARENGPTSHGERYDE